MKPIIGITTSIDEKRNYLNHVYVSAVAQAGGVPLVLPVGGNVAEMLDIVHGLLLSGGGDIDGRFFGQPTHEKATDIWPRRDEAEIAAARLAYARNMPILGICRGLQVLNVALGGDLIQHIDGHNQAEPRDMPTHTVRASGRLAQIMGAADVEVNSIHHQAVDAVADGLHICATAPDGTIEALFAADKAFVLGVQWHPEELTRFPAHFKIFKDFINHAGGAHGRIL